MPGGEVCDESLNDQANQGGRERFRSKNWVRNGFQGSGKKRQSQNGEYVICNVWITISNCVTLYSE